MAEREVGMEARRSTHVLCNMYRIDVSRWRFAALSQQRKAEEFIHDLPAEMNKQANAALRGGKKGRFREAVTFAPPRQPA